jgi:CheY-like chemotaxis protein
MARRLAEYCGGRLALEKATSFCAVLTFPAPEQVQVLIIEDNADTQQLFQRYALGTRYCLTDARDPGHALELAARLRPRIIVLDVMMPEVDGWKVLSRLRQDPVTSHIPVVICTILPHEELALSLGANAFVQKPVSRQAFLAALDTQVTQVH